VLTQRAQALGTADDITAMTAERAELEINYFLNSIIK
jgi:hypothetical protein